MAGVRRFLPCLVSTYQYCSSHHEGEIRSVTERGFLGFVRKRSIGDRRSSASGAGLRGASIDAELSLSVRLASESSKRLVVN